MLPSRSAAQAGSDTSWLSSAIEVLPKRLYFGSFRFLPPESSSLHLFCIDDTLVYEPFYAVRITPHFTLTLSPPGSNPCAQDFGPLNLGCLYAAPPHTSPNAAPALISAQVSLLPIAKGEARQ
jgi:hypothetical protein